MAKITSGGDNKGQPIQYRSASKGVPVQMDNSIWPRNYHPKNISVSGQVPRVPPLSGENSRDPDDRGVTSGGNLLAKIGLDTSRRIETWTRSMNGWLVNGSARVTSPINGTVSSSPLPGAFLNDSNCSPFDTAASCLFLNDSRVNGTEVISEDTLPELPVKIYWALLLVLLPFLAVFGNILIILSVYKERGLQSATNYFIVSLAFADLLVAAVVMPFAVYVLVNVDWDLSDTLCDFYIAVDVTCSTASIFNLVAISIDRFIAVTQPIKYSKHKNNKRVALTIAIVWVVSAAIGSPIVLGLNTSPERVPQQCIFYNSDFIIYSSLSSFYIPCLVMIFLYYRIFKAIHERARKATKKSHPVGDNRRGLVIENIAQTQKLQDTPKSKQLKKGKGLKGQKKGQLLQVVNETEPVTNTGSGSQCEDEEEEENTGEGGKSPDEADDCHIITNVKTTDHFVLSTVNETGVGERSGVQVPEEIVPFNGNTDSGYAASNVEETQFFAQNPNTESPKQKLRLDSVETVGDTGEDEEDQEEEDLEDVTTTTRSRPTVSTISELALSASKKNGTASPVLSDSAVSGRPVTRTHSDSLISATDSKKKSKFNIGRKRKSSRKKRERASAKRERKATKTLAIVLGVFLFCWVPFFTCNIMDAICIKLESSECRPGMTAFLLTTWLGYMNSVINPVIYTIFNPQFRNAFKKILTTTC